MLDTCGQYFDRGSGKKKLDAFLVFFQASPPPLPSLPHPFPPLSPSLPSLSPPLPLFPPLPSFPPSLPSTSIKQCYIFRKRQPIPLELEHMILDTLESLRPDFVPYTTFQEAYEAASELELKYKDKIGEWDV